MKNIILIAGLALFAFGCDGNHIIGDLPNCIDSVTDECVPEVIEEFCDDCETCEVCEVCEVCETCEVCPPPEPPICFERIATETCERVCVRERYGNCCEWADACETTVDFVLVDCPDEPLVCPEEPLSCDDYGDDVPRGHLPKECRGNGPLVK